MSIVRTTGTSLFNTNKWKIGRRVLIQRYTRMSQKWTRHQQCLKVDDSLQPIGDRWNSEQKRKPITVNTKTCGPDFLWSIEPTVGRLLRGQNHQHHIREETPAVTEHFKTRLRVPRAQLQTLYTCNSQLQNLANRSSRKWIVEGFRTRFALLTLQQN